LSPKVLSSTIFCFFAKSTFDCCFGGISYLHPNRYNSHSLATESAFDYAGDGESDDTGGVASICWWRGSVRGFVWCFGRRRYQLEVGIPEGTYGYGLTDLSLGFLMRGALWLEMVQSSFVPRKTPYSRIFLFF
jgi:hypothetical protein